MPPSDPFDHDADARSALRGLEERLERASAAAERLIADAGAYATGRSRERPPAAGWQAPGTGPADSGRDGTTPELELIIETLHAVRDLIPEELATRIAAALRELLLAMRALIDWYVERLDRRRPARAPVEDIPIL